MTRNPRQPGAGASRPESLNGFLSVVISRCLLQYASGVSNLRDYSLGVGLERVFKSINDKEKLIEVIY
jgi:hypothetical protein